MSIGNYVDFYCSLEHARNVSEECKSLSGRESYSLMARVNSALLW